MPVICTDPEIRDRIDKICAKFKGYFRPEYFSDVQDALEHMKYELPEMSVIFFSDPKINGWSVLEAIKADPWLHYGGIIAVYSRKDQARIDEEKTGSNIVVDIPRSQFVGSFYRVLRILVQNRQIIFQRDLQSYLIHNISGSFVMDNDPLNIRTYASLVTSYLYNLNYINQDMKERLHVALFELLMNAVEHGNCNISYDEKTSWLQENGDILELIREKARLPEVHDKRVYFSYRISTDKSVFTIRDEGDGFDWRSRLTPLDEAHLGSHGHGIRMTNLYVENLRYNDDGTEVTFEFSHQRHESNVVPKIFEGQHERTFTDGQIVFREGEESNFLYYIVSGEFDVFSGETKVSSLNPDDIFLGEMSFLLNDRRSATVKSCGDSALIPISKNAFVGVIKQKPHYGIFLARLLAQRLSRLNVQHAKLRHQGKSAGT